MKSNPTLGILGGLGPMATVYFYELLTSRTAAQTDQEHLNLLISSHAQTPDRSAFITGKSSESPLPCMIEDAKKLVSIGADLLVMPCNTAHYFYEELSRSVPVPFINIIEETVRYCQNASFQKIGILATEGTVYSGAYQHVCQKFGLPCEVPSPEKQAVLHHIIYDQIKRGLPADMTEFDLVANELRQRGCEAMVLGCTELSLIKKEQHLDDTFVDSMEVLADVTISACGKTVVGEASKSSEDKGI